MGQITGDYVSGGAKNTHSRPELTSSNNTFIMFDIRGKNAIVTGAARGIGKEMARLLIKNGARVCVSDIDVQEGEKTVAEFKQEFGLKDDEICFIRCDVSLREEWPKLWDAAEAKLGGSKKVELLCNNAGVPPQIGYKKCIDVMTVGFSEGVYTAVARMGKSKGGSGGRIVNTCSMASLTIGSLGDITSAGYNISKWGNMALTRSFAEVLPDVYDTEGVKCYGLCPWFVDTRLVNQSFELAPKGGFESRFSSVKVHNMDDLVESTKNRALTAEEIAGAMMESLRVDKTGAMYIVFPEVPLVEVPSIHNVLCLSYIAAAKIGHFLGFRVFKAWQFGIVLFIALYVLFSLFQWLICAIF